MEERWMEESKKKNKDSDRSLKTERMGDANIIPQNKSNQTMVVKHCQAFQISVAHQRDLEAHDNQHTPSRTKRIKK